MRMPSLTLLACISLLLFGCASSSPTAPKDADETMVAQCTFLGNVSGSSMAGMASRGMERARGTARRKAEAMGATHVVWGNVSGNYNGSSADGRAYRCSK
jgi:uncharacterized lipoprotein NlpE involved in copper resistance